MYQIKQLQKTDIHDIYQQHMKYDFPDNERRSENNILSLMEKEQYLGYGFYQENNLLGYAFCFCHEEMILLDYFAIIASKRNQGLGSTFMHLFIDACKDKTVILEAENPDIDPSEEKTRRVQFYLRNGYLRLPESITLYFVHYALLASKLTTKNQLESLYHAFYQEPFYSKFLKFD